MLLCGCVMTMWGFLRRWIIIRVFRVSLVFTAFSVCVATIGILLMTTITITTMMMIIIAVVWSRSVRFSYVLYVKSCR